MLKILSGLCIILSISSACVLAPDHTSPIEASTKDSADDISVSDYVVGLTVPWDFEFAPDKTLYITERPGRIRVVRDGQLVKKALHTLDDVVCKGESGLMGLALHPDFSTNGWLYVCYSTKKEASIINRIKRFRVNNDTLTDGKVLLDDIPGAQVHDGCGLRFGPDKKLYITTGEATKKEYAQKFDSLLGKTLRINDDGTIPSDNPFYNKAGARQEIWSLGHRNAQGIDFQPGSDIMFQTEHGPSGFDGPGGGDEVNIVRAGDNLGWPIVHHDKKKPGYRSPLLEFTPAIAPAGASFYRSAKVKKWSGNLFFACLKGQSVMRIELSGEKVVHQERLFHKKFGRIRHVAEGPDGALYFSTSNRDGRGEPKAPDDRIIRAMPTSG